MSKNLNDIARDLASILLRFERDNGVNVSIRPCKFGGSTHDIVVLEERQDSENYGEYVDHPSKQV